MKNVWLILENNGELPSDFEEHVLGVFTSEQLAKDYLEGNGYIHEDHEWKLEDHYMSYYARIVQFELNKGAEGS